MNFELEDSLYKKIIAYSDEGNLFADSEDYEKAIQKFSDALSIIPDPKNNWEASTWLYASIGDMYFLQKKFKDAVNYFYNALNCPNGIENPFIYLRVGECFYEMENWDKAKENLLKAYMLDSREIFIKEDQKYLNLIKPLI